MARVRQAFEIFRLEAWFKEQPGHLISHKDFDCGVMRELSEGSRIQCVKIANKSCVFEEELKIILPYRV